MEKSLLLKITSETGGNFILFLIGGIILILVIIKIFLDKIVFPEINKAFPKPKISEEKETDKFKKRINPIKDFIGGIILFFVMFSEMKKNFFNASETNYQKPYKK